MLNVLICGVNGTMGQVLAGAVASADGVTTVAGVDLFADARENEFPVYKTIDQCQEDVDVVIDFSRPSALAGNLDFAKARSIPIVIATTGYTEEEKQLIAECAQHVPVFFTANMSLGVNLQMHLCRQAASFFGRDVDIEIVETHHNRKVDAPSGTALALADTINACYGNALDYHLGRAGREAKRTDHEIGIHAVRGGNIIGEHQVLFITDSEIVEITHRSQSKQVYAAGAIRAAHFLMDKGPGLYSMQDILFEARTVTQLHISQGEALVSIKNMPHDITMTAEIFEAIADAGINLDIINQSSPQNGLMDISFSLSDEDLEQALQVLQRFKPLTIETRTGLAKLTVEGIGMQARHGVAARLFRALSGEQVHVAIITTSEVKISFCVDEADMAKASQVVKQEFHL